MNRLKIWRSVGKIFEELDKICFNPHRLAHPTKEPKTHGARKSLAVLRTWTQEKQSWCPGRLFEVGFRPDLLMASKAIEFHKEDSLLGVCGSF